LLYQRINIQDINTKITLIVDAIVTPSIKKFLGANSIDEITIINTD
tara:strand:- start:231 stop:368 length:138 start_codon:yes stop_codon:yes gene_type:complete